MSNIPQGAESPLTIADRRLSVRLPVPSLAYVDLGENNGGIILNLGEGGMAVTLVAPLYGDRPARMRFQLPGAGDWLEASGEVARISESRKEAGLRFVNLSDDARMRIKDWVLAESAGTPPQESPSDQNETTVGAWPTRSAKNATAEFARPEQAAPKQAQDFAPVAEPNTRLRPQQGPTRRRVPREEQFAPDNLDQATDTLRDFDRRIHVRRLVPSLAYVDLGENNGGVILNIGEGGIALTSAAPLYEGVVAQMRFQLPGSNQWLEASGEIARISESKKEAGLRFVNLTEGARDQIKDWISSDISAADSQQDEAGSRERAWRRLEMPIIGAAQSLPPQSSNSRRVVQKNARLLMSQSHPASTPATTSTWAAASAPTELSSTAWGQIGHGLGAEAEDSRKRFLLRWGPWMVFALVLFLGAFFAGWFTAGPGSLNRRLAPLVKTGPETNETAGAAESSPAAPGVTVPEHPSSAPTETRSSEHAAANRGVNAGGSSARVASSQTHTVPTGSVSATAVASQPSASAPEAPASVVPQSPQTSGPGSPSPSVNQPAGAQAAGTTELASLPPAKPAEIPVVAKSAVSVSFGPYPSIRVPAGLKPQMSQKGMALQIGQLLSRVDPVYPEDAKTQQIEGSVKLHAVIARDGTIQSVETRGGPALLTPAAEGAVRQWRFTPSSIGGQPVEAEEDITITFRLAAQPTHSN
jgi:TonB family protein